MARSAVQFVCSECGTATPRWLGKCPGCGAFGTLLEESCGRSDTGTGPASARAPVPLGQVVTSEAERISTGIAELDRVLGGGIVPGSLVLVGGEPGVGKSTITLAALANVAAQRPVLYVTGEE